MKQNHPLLLVAIMFAISIGACSPSVENSSKEQVSGSFSSIETSNIASSSELSSASLVSSSSEKTNSSLSFSNSSSETRSHDSFNPPEEKYFKKNVIVNLDPGLSKAEQATTYEIPFEYNDGFFIRNAKLYDRDLSMLSFGASIATATKARADAFYSEIGFKDIMSHDYDKEPTKDTMGYYIAHKPINDFELVTVAFRGFNYGMEWANNFLIGKSGNHEGFSARGLEAYRDLILYINQYCKDKSVKLWINGYSRAGALCHVLSSMILKMNQPQVSQENMFVYTFEAPASLTDADTIAYENIHNIRNEADLITFIPPTSYGLKRCGVDYPIYDFNVTAIAKEFDENIEIPEFKDVATSSATYSEDTDFCQYIIGNIFDNNLADDDKAAHTREQYVENYQDSLGTMIAYLFSLKAATRSALLNDLTADLTSALMMLSDSSGKTFADFLKPYLEKDNVQYDADTFESDCAVLIKGIVNLFGGVLTMLMNSDQKGDLTRLIDMHYPETTYVLLLNAHKS